MGESRVQIPICSASVLLSIRTIPVSRTHQHQITQPWLLSPAWVIKLLASGMGLGACRQPARAPGNSYPRRSTPVQSGMNFPFHQQPSGVCDPGRAAVSRLHSSALGLESSGFIRMENQSSNSGLPVVRKPTARVLK